MTLAEVFEFAGVPMPNASAPTQRAEGGLPLGTVLAAFVGLSPRCGGR